MTTHVPSHTDLMFPVLPGLQAIGESGSSVEIDEWIIQHKRFTDEQLQVTVDPRRISSIGPPPIANPLESEQFPPTTPSHR